MIPGITELAWAVCARETGHLLTVGQHVLAYCARCTAWYSGIGLSASVLWLARRGHRTQLPGRMVSLLVIGLISLMGLDALFDSWNWHAATLPSRVVSGSLAGAGVPLLMLPLLASLNSRGEQQPVCHAWEAAGLGVLGGLQAWVLWLIPGWRGWMASGAAVYFTAAAILGMGLLLYSASRLLLSWFAHRRAFDSWWGAWLLAGALWTVFYLWHTLVAGPGG